MEVIWLLGKTSRGIRVTMTEESGALGIVVEGDVEVPMRDGIILRANLFRPEASGGFPGLLIRTPYSKAQGGFERYVRAGYAVVAQDSRGRYASDGEFVPFTVENTGDAEDGYDSVEWLADQPYCDGRVGTMGASYNAWMQWELARLRPPHLVAMAAYTIPLELTEVDWPGGFKPGRRVKWWMTTIASDLRKREGLPGPHTPAEARRLWDEVEQGRWLGFMPWLDLPRYLPKRLAEYAEDWLQHPNRRPWRFDEIHAEVEVPNLDFSGWYDHCNGTLGHLGLMQKNAGTEKARSQSKLVIGPWNHPGLGKRQIGEIDFGPQAAIDINDAIIHWFDFWLKGLDNGVDRQPAVRYFVMGAGKWKSAGTWPPEISGEAVYFLGDEGSLREEVPEGQGCDVYTYDPLDPVPTLWTPELFTVPADRRVLEYRQDILCYRTIPLDEEAEVVGHAEMVLHASSSTSDTDFFVRLVDEYPDGRALEVCYGMVRARHRNSLDREEFLVPGEVTEYRIKLGATACRFLKGHRIRIEITSSDFPNHDRNHNTGGNDLAETELVAAEQKVFRCREFPSRLILPVNRHIS